MSDTVTSDAAASWTAADLVRRFGPIPLNRLRLDIALGTATEEDVVRLSEHGDRLYELVEGTLVEKAMGTYESYLALLIGRLLGNFAAEQQLGIVLGADGILRLAPGLVRIPDVSFIAWDRLPNRQIPTQPIAELVPDLAVEVISRGNTAEEMNRKLQDYFAAGCQQVWYVYPQQREAHVFASPEDRTVLTEHETLHAKGVLSGLTISLRELFTPAAP